MDLRSGRGRGRERVFWGKREMGGTEKVRKVVACQETGGRRRGGGMGGRGIKERKQTRGRLEWKSNLEEEDGWMDGWMDMNEPMSIF